ncbi:MAG: phosphatidate cytidylyltransferase [Bacteroidota bacterium]
MKGLIRRVITATFFVIIMLVGLFTGPVTFGALFLLITGACLWEFFSMVLDKRSRRDKIRKSFGVALGLLPFILVLIFKLRGIPPSEELVQLASLLFSPLIFSIFIYELYAGSKEPFVNIAFLILGLFYIGVPFALLDFIAFDGQEFMYRVVFGILVLTWVNDTGAYLVGSQIGKTPLFPRISPNKTWEGTIGGIVTTLIFGGLLGLYFDEIALQHWLVLAVIVAVFGTLGDLVESMLKRSVGVKDSGTLLPGHGGVLDRFDGFIFVVPFAAAFILYLR